MDEKELVCEAVPFDGPQYYAYELRFRKPESDQVIATFHDIKWNKDNEFLGDPGVISTTRGQMSTTLLEKKTGTIDNGHEFNSWVEYRPIGSDEIVHRSAHVKLKVPPSPVYVSAGRVS